MIVLSELSDRYRIALDEVWQYELSEVRNPSRRWHEQIPCREGGFIYLYSEDPPTLGLYTTQVKSARAIMSKITGLQAEWMEGEAVILFPPEVLNQVAELAGGRKKRQGRKLTPAEKSNLLEAGMAHRFKNNSTGLQEENPAQV